MQKRIAIQIIFLGTFFLMQPLCAADGMNLPDVTGTPLSSEMAKFKAILLGKPTLDQLNGLKKMAFQFCGAPDENSERSLLGKLYEAQIKLLQAQAQLKENGSSHTTEGQKLDKLSARIQDLEDAIEGTEGKPGLHVLLNEKDQEIAQLKQAQKKDGHTPSAAVHDQKTNEADSAQITLLKRNAVRAKIVIGCMSAFIIVDKVVIPIIRKCRSAWRDRHDKHKRADAWTALRTRFQKAQK